MTLDQINYFIEIVKAGSMTEAATKLMVSQPQMSMTVSSLEIEMGCKLLHRTSKGIELTKQGSLFLHYAESIKLNIEQMKSINKVDENPHIKFTVSAQYIAYSILPLIEMLNLYENQSRTLVLRSKPVFSVIEDVELDLSELGLVCISSDQRVLLESFVNKKGIEFNLLGSLEMCIVIPKGHDLFEREKLEVSDITGYPLAFLDISNKDSLYPLFFKQLDYELFPQKILVQDYFFIYHLLSTGNFVSFLSNYNNSNINKLYEEAGLTLKFHPLNPKVELELYYIKKINNPLTLMGQYFINKLSSKMFSDSVEKEN